MKYAILNTSDINTVDFSKVKQTDANSVRKTLDGSKFMVKFEGDTPDFFRRCNTLHKPRNDRDFLEYRQRLAVRRRGLKLLT
jgi:hypothetical protein